jgi:hypothetical protein
VENTECRLASPAGLILTNRISQRAVSLQSTDCETDPSV